MSDHAYEIARAFYPDQPQRCACGWWEPNLLEMRRHLLYPERGMPVELEQVQQLAEPVLLTSCRIDGCPKRRYRIGLCHQHFNAWRRRDVAAA